ncbi:MAG: amidohydrolase family protein [Oscillospiraceae bacterium]|jgi:predicted TIM-barrel fold metal-dependent hydrolase|nr:amidohydrolase family protein [Oscillospiraceae bacterium]
MPDIFANHAHVFPGELKPEGTVDRLLQLMDACGIARAVCFAPFAERHAPAESGARNWNQWLAGEIAGEERLLGFGTVDFSVRHPAPTVQAAEIAILGLKGVKLHPAAQGVDLLGKQARELYAAAEKLGLFLSFHTGLHWSRLRECRPLLFDELNWDYPKLRFSMEHIGGYAFFREAMAALANGSNGYAGWTSIQPGKNGVPGVWSLSNMELCAVVNQLGPERSVFGLDFPYKKEPEIQAAIERFGALPISDEAKAGLFGGNLARALGV